MNDSILCEKCGTLFKDPIVHAVTKCDSTSEARDLFWCDILNINPISFSIHLADLTDDILVIRLRLANLTLIWNPKNVISSD